MVWTFVFGVLVGIFVTLYLYNKYSEYSMYNWAKEWNEIKAKIKANKGKKK